MAGAGISDECAQEYLRAAADMLALPLPPERAARVLQQFRRTVAIAQPLLDFALPERIDPAAEFEP